MERNLNNRSGMNITLGGMALNIALALIKFLGGLFGGSKALIADSLHSLSDLISDILALVGLHFRYKESDDSHPYGHGKIESLTTIGVGLLLLGVAFWVGFDAIKTMYRKTFLRPDTYTIWIAGVSIVTKEVLFRFTDKTAGEIRSEVLHANAWHHRSDAITSAIIFVSITGARLFPELVFLDSAAALIVSIFILVISLDIIRKPISKIIDTSPSGKLLNSVAERMRDIEGVIDVHDISGRYYADIIRMEAHLEVSPDITVAEAHNIADKAEQRVIREFDEISSVLIHIDPY
ncbi:MAG: cation diffusion facilitator family transporter, partial [Candidatus Krumholzibacteriota bacterium]